MLAVTMGDANGVGPEIILSAYMKGAMNSEFFVIGDYSALSLCNQQLKFGAEIQKIEDIKEITADKINILDMNLLDEKDLKAGMISEKVAAASRSYIVKATEMTLDKKAGAVVTLPVNKEGIRLTDPVFTGHTELIAQMCGKDNYTMMLASDKLTVTHVTTHVSMEEAVRLIQKERVYDVIQLTYENLSRFLDVPRIAIAGLNPHAGEGGAFGRQEIDEIIPAINRANARGYQVTGPMPPDTVFLRAVNGEFDAVVCMYHDQGHIPMKLLDFEGGVNVTLGLPVIRTSVDHGTAFDIAWEKKASPHSFIEAFQYAEKLI